MRFIDFEVKTGKENMQKDSDLLDEAIQKGYDEPIFRLYGWKPACVSLGRNQKEDFVDNKLLEKYGIDCVRRLTGGRALLHDNELTYSYICPVLSIENGENVTASYKFISGLWIDIFKNLGIELTIGGAPRHITKNNYCMSVSTGADLCWNNRKFIGSAQCRKNGYILQHGSILIDYDREKLDTIFNEETDYSTIVTLKEINPDLNIEDIILAAKNCK
jgi:lipoate-protein ligase A